LCDLPEPAQMALIRYAGGTKLYIPKAEHLRIHRRNEAIRKAYDSGCRVQDIARQHGLTERWVYEILNRPGERPAQSRGNCGNK
ncbi:MAG: Mor transcription activator family protein, partial [Thiobacillaceae bacterium]